ncbi:MAG: phosphate ABC transporter substrate-binding protein PstS [Streptosporangiaceae bacterium]|nr:phosphate ABC transporter substrate-binding protein PstS [Streptosporangiaceae bacterium]
MVALALLTAACGTGTSTGGETAGSRAGPGGTITEAGSGLLDPLAVAWATAYHQQFADVTVTTASVGSGKGIALATAGKIDIGASDAYLSSGDLVKNQNLLNVPLAISAQTIIYNLPGMSQGSHVQLNGTVLAGIYDGTITTWNDPAIASLNQGLHLPDIKIVPIHRSDSSGDTFLFTSYLSTQDPNWNDAIGYGTTAAWPQVPRAKGANGSVNTMNDCEHTPGCVAYNGISYLSKALAGRLGEAALANSAGRYTLPTASAIRDSVGSFVSITPPNETISMIEGPSATGYPIINYEYAVVSTRQPNATKASMIRAFLKWVITTGNDASYVDRVGFQPLPAAVVSLGEAQIAEIGP